MNQQTLPDYLMVAQNYKDEVLGKQGEIGLVVLGYETDDTFFLRFEDGQIGSYPADALLSLKSAKEVMDYLEWNVSDISKQDFRTLHNLTFFIEHGTMDAQKKGLTLAKTNPTILDASTTLLREALDLSHSRRYGR